jgi:hypothetical protein
MECSHSVTPRGLGQDLLLPRNHVLEAEALAGSELVAAGLDSGRDKGARKWRSGVCHE